MKSIFLRSGHLHLESHLVARYFATTDYALVFYQEDKQRLLIAPESSQWFAKMYQANRIMLKVRNLKGDKALAIRELIIDHELNSADRELAYEVVEKTGLIKVILS